MIKLFLDSGAFTVWQSGGTVELSGYAKALNRWMKELPEGMIEVAANLDVMPGQPGSTPSTTQVESAAQQSWKNFKSLKSKLDPAVPLIPVFHRGERLYWLEKMLGEGETYIGLGAIARASGVVRRTWLDQVFSAISKGGYPCVRLHGLGINAVSIRLGYPWHSVDSFTWMRTAAVGKIYFPSGPDRWEQVSMSRLTAGARDSYWSLGSTTKGLVDAWLQSIGRTVEEVTEKKMARAAVNVRCIQRLEGIPIRPFMPTAKFSARMAPIAKPRKEPFSKFVNTYLVCDPWNVADSWALNFLRYPRRLISYHKIISAKGKDLRTYLEQCAEDMSGPPKQIPFEKHRKKNRHAFTNRPPQ